MESQNQQLPLANQNEQKTSEILINFVQEIDTKEKKFDKDFTNGYLHKIVITDILKWADKNQPNCLQMICDFLKKSESSIKENNEKSKVNELVKNLIDNWEENETCQHLQDIKNNIIKHPRSAFILKSYKQIISKQIIGNKNEDNNFLEAHKFFREIGLIREEREGFYEVSNLLYQRVFSKEWIANTFKKDRPYNDQFMAWEQSYQQDNSSIEHLISGDELINALEWITDLQIPLEEEIYLIRSRVFN